MIFNDWVSAVLPCQHTPEQLRGDKILRHTAEGEVIWETRTASFIEGSFSEKIQVKSWDGGKSIFMSGNPNKFFNSHNIYGHWNPHFLTLKTYYVIVKEFGLTPTVNDYMAMKSGNYDFTRLDFTGMYDIDGTNRGVEDWLENAEFTSRTRAGRPACKSGTIYWGGGKNSRYGVKAYNKKQEVEVRQKKKDAMDMPFELMEWVEGKLRLEVQLNKKELQRISGLQKNMEKAYNWLEYSFIEERYAHYIEKLQLNDTGKIMKHSYYEIINMLPTGVRNTYIAWEAGINIKDTMARRTFYNHRKQILECVGIDITFHRENSRLAEKSNVVPLVRVLEAKPATPPKEILEKYVIGY